MTRDELIGALLCEGWRRHTRVTNPACLAATIMIGDVELFVWAQPSQTDVLVDAQYWPSWELLESWTWRGSPADARQAIRHGELVIRKRMAMTFANDDPEALQ